MRVAEYGPEKAIICGLECRDNTEDQDHFALTIANDEPGYIEESTVFVDQQNKDFGVENIYTIRFRPKNAIPNVGWIKITYPTTVSIADPDEFVSSCEAVTSASYKGPDYCKLITESREIWIFDAFMDQTSYTSEIGVSFIMTNPDTNKEIDTSEMTEEEIIAYEYGLAFHIETFTFDLSHDFPDVLSSSYAPDAIKAFLEKAIQSPNDYTYLIDKLPGNNVKPKLLCNAPCYTCLESDPDYCTSCWGEGVNKDNKDIFLSRLPGQQTCTPYCVDGQTTNGNVINKDDAAKKYYKCEECEMFCGSCKGQSKPNEEGVVESYGKAGDKSRCVTCSVIFQFLVALEEKCYVTCGAGYYEKLVGNYPDPSECGICKAPCNTCKKCDPLKDKNCDATKDEPSASFCTSCKQDGFFPAEIEVVDTKEQFFVNQAGMVENKVVTLN